MKEWQLQHAKARLSEVIRNSAQAPQVITLHGEKVAVVMSIGKYDKLAKPKENLSDFLLNSPLRDVNIDFPRDKSTKMRKIDL